MNLETLITEYNETESTQAARLKAIYTLAAQLEGGGHEIRFSNGELIGQNILRHADHTVIDLQLAKLIALITHWQ
jgi:hypothetical protein